MVSRFRVNSCSCTSRADRASAISLKVAASTPSSSEEPSGTLCRKLPWAIVRADRIRVRSERVMPRAVNQVKNTTGRASAPVVRASQNPSLRWGRSTSLSSTSTPAFQPKAVSESGAIPESLLAPSGIR